MRTQLPGYVEMTDGGALVETRDGLIEAIEKYLSNGGPAKFRVIAAMDINITFDDVLGGDVLRVGKYEFSFTRSKHIPLGEYYILQGGGK